MKILKVKKLRDDAIIPQKAHLTDSGFDLFTVEDIILWPGDTMLAKTGIAIELEPGYEAQVRSKSGLALKSGIVVLNSPGTVDCGYKNEVGVILHNTNKAGSDKVFKAKAGTKIAQMVIQKVELPEIIEVDEIYPEGTERDMGGFGSTGLNADK